VATDGRVVLPTPPRTGQPLTGVVLVSARFALVLRRTDATDQARLMPGQHRSGHECGAMAQRQAAYARGLQIAGRAPAGADGPTGVEVAGCPKDPLPRGRSDARANHCGNAGPAPFRRRCRASVPGRAVVRRATRSWEAPPGAQPAARSANRGLAAQGARRPPGLENT